MRRSGFFTAAALSAMLLFALAGCGSEDDDNGPIEPPDSELSLVVAGGGNNVPDRYTSDLWVHGNHAYTGTWGGSGRNGNPGNALKIWTLDAAGAPILADSVVIPNIGTVSDTSSN
jgi:predicted small lipoprotein YifL